MMVPLRRVLLFGICFILLLSLLDLQIHFSINLHQLFSPNRPHLSKEFERNVLMNITSTSGATPIKRCHPKEQIVAIKTHKTASSTLASIFQRYGMSRNLLFATPAFGNTFPLPWIKAATVFGYGKVVKYWGGFDMSVSHGRYHRRELEAIVPNATYVTAIRNPVDHFVSSFIYFNYSRQVRIPHNSENIMSKFFEIEDFQNKIGYGNHQVSNGIAHDLAINTTGNITEEIRRLDRDFDLVILSEYFDESLLLLKELLCWEMDDLLYLPIRKHIKIYDHLYNVSDEDKRRILELNQVDAAIYEYFKQIFWRKVEEYGPTFDKDLKELRDRLRVLEEECNASAREAYEVVRGFRTYDIQSNDTEYCKTFLTIDDVNTKKSHEDLESKIMALELDSKKRNGSI